MLQTKALTKKYGDQTALDSLDLEIAPGEIFCLLGANGAGKTTTINLFLDFIEPTSGAALINGLDVHQNGLATKQFVAYIPEQVTLYRNLTGLENLRFFASLATGEDFGMTKLRSILKSAGLPDGAAEKRVGTYSKGMRQKVGIAIAMAKDAKALLLDEPTSGLDPKASNEFSELLTRLSGEGVAILMATHDLFRARETGTRIGIMRAGKLRQTLRASEIGHADLEALYLEHMRD
ncbi:ABC transporter ATP-binding protein [Nevskia sp.]|uniref:ABC transporter ATP-binding protein n=1 Tax=Nevskia sp. TaxID=1929292 RepID=UPI0034588919